MSHLALYFFSIKIETLYISSDCWNMQRDYNENSSLEGIMELKAICRNI